MASYDSSSIKELLTPKNIGIAVVTLLILGFMGYRLADHYGVINAEKPSTDPAVVDPISTYTPEEKKQLEKLQEQQQREEQMPNRPPPAGS